MKALVRALATLGPVGYVPIAPATAASAVTALVAWWLPVPPLGWALLLLAGGGLAAVAVCDLAERDLGHDAHPIVADEVIGQSIALLFAPRLWWVYVAALVLFRVFDVFKPLGAHRAQSLPGGWGIVADDVMAGLMSCATLQALIWGLREIGSRF